MEKKKSSYLGIVSFIVNVKTKEIYVDIAKAVETRFDT